MKRLSTLAAASAVLAAALMTSGCIMVNGADVSDGGWRGTNAQPFDASRDDCHRTTDSASTFRACMADKGWTRR